MSGLSSAVLSLASLSSVLLALGMVAMVVDDANGEEAVESDVVAIVVGGLAGIAEAAA